MRKTLKKKYNFLHDVVRLSKKDRQKYLSECSKENIDDICEAIYNLLKGYCPIKSKNGCKKLSAIERELKKVVNPKSRLGLKRKILTSSQTGDGIFSIIASSVLPFLVNLLTGK